MTKIGTTRWMIVLVAAGLMLAALFALNAISAPLAVLATPQPSLYPPVKQTFEASVAQTRAAALAVPTPTAGARPPIVPTTTRVIAARQPAGAGWIVNDITPPFPAMSHVITNLWYAESNGKRVTVYAGALRDEPGISPSATQSVVIVVIENLDGAPLPGGGTFRAPKAAGALQIVDAANEQLVLQAASGEKFYFAVPTRAFVSSPN